jgi:8-oxo-dGTP pyrophosphatase MutT (NUDIX family)
MNINVFKIYKKYFIKVKTIEGVRIILKNEDRYLLLKYKDNKKGTLWDVPGGTREKKEKIEETAKRELKEETGINVENLSYLGKKITFHKNIRKKYHGFFGKIKTYKVKLSEEHNSFSWEKVENFKKLENFKDAKLYKNLISQLKFT